MADIYIEFPHDCEPKRLFLILKARTEAKARQYRLEPRWLENSGYIKGSVNAELAVDPKLVMFKAKLPLHLWPLKHRVRSEVRQAIEASVTEAKS
jgi:Putative polyhydroxyalkanoic acid system protein (PHA_gran_rgn)